MKGMTDKPMGTSKTGPVPKPETLSEPEIRLSVDVMHHSPEWADEVEDAFLMRAANAAYMEGSSATPPAEISLLLTANEEIRTLNKNWRSRDEATNVLSFPLNAPQCSKAPNTLGDVAMAFQTVANEAAERNIPVSQHAAHLVVHGVLHLLGYTHTNDSQARKMEALEIRILETLDLPDPYAIDVMTRGEGQ